MISAINGYHTADLSGPLVVSGTQPVDRISFDALHPGASIVTGGDLNTLDVLNGINLNSGPGIVIGRDLNLINVGLDVNLSNGASIRVGRYLGLQPQPPKGTGNGSNFLSLNQSLLGTNSAAVLPGLAGNIRGNLILGAGSTFTVNNGIPNTSITTGITGTLPVTISEAFLVNGAVIGTSTLGSQIPAPQPRAFSTRTIPSPIRRSPVRSPISSPATDSSSPTSSSPTTDLIPAKRPSPAPTTLGPGRAHRPTAGGRSAPGLGPPRRPPKRELSLKRIRVGHRTRPTAESS